MSSITMRLWVAASVGVFLVAAPVRADDEALLDALSGCDSAGPAVEALGMRWEEVLVEADWDPMAAGPRAFAGAVAPGLRRVLFDRSLPLRARREALALLVELREPSLSPVYRTMLERRSCPPDWTALAGHGLARLDTDAGRAALVAVMEATVRQDRAPEPEAWSLCTAATRAFAGRDLPAPIQTAVRRMFLFAPQAATASCLPLVLGLPDAAVLARQVIDGDGWPAELEGPDPRVPSMLLHYGRGAALIVLGELRTDDAFDRLSAALDDTSIMAAPTRDGAIQGLATLAGPRARRRLRALLRDPELQTPRVAHALLRLGDVESANTLRDVALDADALVEMRMSAANAYTLLVDGRRNLVRDWERDLARAPRFGPPFEALDARMVETTRRLVAAERCRRRAECWAEMLMDTDRQGAARAFWQLSRSPEVDGEAAPALAEIAARVLHETTPNEDHDLVSGAIALLARVDPEHAHPYLTVIRRARIAWEGRTNPMGLPFDIPLALGQLERRVRDD